MFRGTTPTLKFRLKANIDFDKISQIWLTILGEKHRLEKTIEDLEIDADEKTISVTLSQEETLAFDVGLADVQMRIYFEDDETSLATVVRKVNFERILREGVIG